MLEPSALRFSIAPMMDWTDRHCRYLHRIMTRKARLYTEMRTPGAVIHGDRERLLGFDSFEKPLALQLGGSEPEQLAKAARIVAEWGYDELNLNVGCPSDRVQNGAFGACLMLRPELVGELVRAMKDAVAIPVTVKCRIGVDDQEPEIALFRLAEAAIAAEADALIVHARKAWLKGLSPRANRDAPPLDYPLVHRLKARFPNVPIAINGGLASIGAIKTELERMDGVMVGRAAYHDPNLLLQVDLELFGAPAPVASGFAAIEAYLPYIERQLSRGAHLSAMTRHMMGFFGGLPGARLYRRKLTEQGVKPGAVTEVVVAAMAEVSRPA